MTTEAEKILKRLSKNQREVLDAIATGSGPMLWGDSRNSSVKASAFWRGERALNDLGLTDFDRDAPYRRRLTIEGAEVHALLRRRAHAALVSDGPSPLEVAARAFLEVARWYVPDSRQTDPDGDYARAEHDLLVALEASRGE